MPMPPNQPQQRQPSGAMKVLFAALDAVVEEAVNEVVGSLQQEEAAAHKANGNAPTPDCHTCMMLGMFPAPTPVPDEETG